MRASWDDTYSPREIMRAHLFLYLAIDAASAGRERHGRATRAYAR